MPEPEQIGSILRRITREHNKCSWPTWSKKKGYHKCGHPCIAHGKYCSGHEKEKGD